MKNAKELLYDMESAARISGAVLLNTQKHARDLLTHKDFLTSADLDSDAIIRHCLETNCPSISYSSEERELKDIKKGWLVDPLDGSWNFFRQDDNWGISIAYMQRARTNAGVVYLPRKRQMFLTDGKQVQANQSDFLLSQMSLPIGVSKRSTLKECSVWTDHNKKDPRLTTSIFNILTRHTRYPQIRLCCTASMMAVVTGEIDGYVHPAPEPFDHAAAGLILKTMGGKVTDLEGNPWHPFSKSLVASNGLIHDDLLSILKLPTHSS